MISNKALACVSNMITSPLALDLNLYNIGDVRGVERGSMLRSSHDSTTVHITCVLSRCLASLVEPQSLKISNTALLKACGFSYITQ